MSAMNVVGPRETHMKIVKSTIRYKAKKTIVCVGKLALNSVLLLGGLKSAHTNFLFMLFRE